MESQVARSGKMMYILCVTAWLLLLCNVQYVGAAQIARRWPTRPTEYFYHEPQYGPPVITSLSPFDAITPPRLIRSLPNEVSNAILRHLPDSDLGNVRLVSRAADGLVQQDATLPYWQRLLRRELAKTVKTASEKLHYLYEMRRYARHCQEMLFIHVDSSLTSALLSKYDKLFLMHDVQFGLIGDVSRLAIERLRTLVGLDLSYLSLTSIDHLRLPASLKRLDLSRNKITSMERISLPEGLEALDLSANQLHLLNDFKLPPQLLSLNISYNAIALPQEMSFPPTLRVFSARDCRLTSFSFLPDLRALEQLDLAGNLLRTLPGLDDASHLKLLDLSGSNLPDLQTFVSLHRLESLILAESLFFNLHEGNTTLLPPQLKHLDVSNCHLRSLQHLHLPAKLDSLVARRNALEDLDGVPLDLVSLNVFRNRLACIKPVEQLTRLRHLNVSSNWVTHIRDVAFPAALQSMDLSCNAIDALDGVRFGDALQDLRLSYNPILTLQGVRLPPLLRTLDLSFSSLMTLSDVELPIDLMVDVQVTPLALPGPLGGAIRAIYFLIRYSKRLSLWREQRLIYDTLY